MQAACTRSLKICRGHSRDLPTNSALHDRRNPTDIPGPLRNCVHYGHSKQESL